MKPALFYTLRRGPYLNSFNVMAVTSEKPRIYYGRNQHGEAHNAKRSSCYGRFATEQEAKDLAQAAQVRWDSHRHTVEEAERAATRARRAREEAVIDLFGGKELDT